MSHHMRSIYRLMALFLIVMLSLTGVSVPRTLAQSGTITAELLASADARIQGGSPDVNFGSGFIWTGSANGHLAYVQFDLMELPANATISNAELHLRFTGVYTGTGNVEVGRSDGVWDEATLTWNNQPANIFNGNIQPVGDTPGDIVWPVTPLVQQWYNGTIPNYGFALRGDGLLKSFHSKETAGPAPRLVITYTIPPEEGSRPDYGDAPDSSNNVGVNPNTAYPGVPGNFPTVWNGTPAGEPAGPRHANATGEGILGQYLSREVEADSGNDQDGVNNILNGGADNADNDRGDDGWRNRQATFDHCAQTTLTVRVSRAQNATLNHMYLNVWFDGNKNGSWGDRELCTPENESLAIPATEWIVQDYYVHMTGIPAGGYVDITINTETVLNTTPESRHWMRFTLSEARAVQTANGRADGRGPHPDSALGSYQFGETEDILQRPAPPAEPGTLELAKRAILDSNPLDQLEEFTYEIRLRHNGGSAPIQAEIRDELPYALYTDPSVYYTSITQLPTVSASGGVSPLQADIEYIPTQWPRPFRYVVKWQGTLAPDAEITLRVKARMFVLCPTGQQTQAITNVAQARPRNGTAISAETTFSADCLGYDLEMIPVDWDEDVLTQPGSLIDLSDLQLRANFRNNHDIPVTLRVTPALNSNLPGNAAIALPSFEKFTLEPGASHKVEFKVRLDEGENGELDLPEEVTLNSLLNYCILPGEDATECIDANQYPQLHGQSDPITITVRPRELGDAPDSTNHPATAMTAYPGIQANFPTVFDPTTGLPEGPMHAHPRPFHLGQQVSREAEADIGPDEDPTNNIIPAANTPNQDRFDDGVNPQQWNLTHCQTTTIPVRVFISPQAVNWFQQQQKQGYLNLWIDSTRDGDWDDGGTCGAGQDAVEHIVIDFPVDLVALGAGLQTINVPTGLVPWPAAQAENPAWARVTLSERESNKTLQFGNIKYGDGRGYDKPFQTGETEDYLAYPEGTVGGGPDLDVQINGRVGQGDRLAFKLDYANLGNRPANDARLIFQKPEQLRDMEIILLRTPGIPAQNIVETGEDVTITLPTLAPGESGVIVIGWKLDAANAGTSYTARTQVTQDGDTDTSNNADEATVETSARAPIIAAAVANGAAWGQRETTCRNSVNLVGRGAPNATYTLTVDGNTAASVTADANGTVTHLLQNLSDGRHTIRLEATQVSRPLLLDVDTSLPIDPLSLVFTDNQGRTIHPPTLGWPLDTSNAGVALRSGETYQVGIDRCGADPNVQIDLTLANETITLRDDDGDGRYTGSFTYAPLVQAAALAAEAGLRFDVTAGNSSLSFTTPLSTLEPGTISDALTGQPVANATVTALAAQATTSGTIFTAWPEVALGQPNPQTTGTDGAYSFVTPGNDNRIDVVRDGYQPYQTGDIAASNGILNQDIALTPAITEAATHTIYVSANGFTPAVLTVQLGSVIEWVNVDLTEHSASGDAWDSGTLNAGGSYRVRLNSAGSYIYQDATNPQNSATIIVEGGGAATENNLYLPIVLR